MDWLRRNWPDLLIGVALIAVIAGIIATLISGGSFFPAGNRTVETPSQNTTSINSSAASAESGQAGAVGQGDDASPAAETPAEGSGAQSSSLTSTPAGAASDQASGASAADAAEASSGAAEGAVADSAADAAAGDDAAAAAGDDRQTNASGLPVAVLPPGQAGNASAANTPAANAQSGAGAPPTSSSLTSTASTPSQASAGQSAAVQTTIVAASDTPDAPYRVSVGAYANRDNAQRQAESFAAAGYPVFIGVQGALNIVLVGPYDSETEARSMADRIQASDMGVSDPTVYEFEGAEATVSTDSADQGAAATNTASSAPVSSVSSSAASPSAASAQPADQSLAESDDDTLITTAPADATGVRYLQAGAYGSRDTSLPQRARLEGLGFVVTERLENDLVKLLIGPFDAANLQSAQGRLEAAGIASFPR